MLRSRRDGQPELVDVVGLHRRVRGLVRHQRRIGRLQIRRRRIRVRDIIKIIPERIELRVQIRVVDVVANPVRLP